MPPLRLHRALRRPHAAAHDRVEVREYKGRAQAAAVANMTVPTVVLSFLTIVAFVAVGTAPRAIGRPRLPMVGHVWAGVVLALTGAIFADVAMWPATALCVGVVLAATATVAATTMAVDKRRRIVTIRAALFVNAALAGAAGGSALDAGAPVAASAALPALVVVGVYALKANIDTV